MAQPWQLCFTNKSFLETILIPLEIKNYANFTRLRSKEKIKMLKFFNIKKVCCMNV